MTNEELVLKVQCGEDVQSNMEKLFLQNEPMITKVVKKYEKVISSRGRTYDPYMKQETDDTIMELKQEAYFALDQAVKEFNNDLECKFLTYLLIVLKKYLITYINNNCSLVRLPINAKAAFARYDDFLETFEKETGRFPSENEMQSILKISAERVKSYRKNRSAANVKSLDDSIELDDDSECGILDSISYEVSPFESPDDVIERITNEQIARDLWQVVDSLPDPYNFIIRLYYQNEMNLEQIASILHLSTSRIGQQKDRALRMLSQKQTIKNMMPHISSAEAYSGGIRGSGLGAFRRTGMSSTERTVLRHIEHSRNRLQRK